MRDHSPEVHLALISPPASEGHRTLDNQRCTQERQKSSSYLQMQHGGTHWNVMVGGHLYCLFGFVSKATSLNSRMAGKSSG